MSAVCLPGLRQDSTKGACILDCIGKLVTVTVDRPLGSRHPMYDELVYPVNYGYVEGVAGGDGEAQDAYILCVDVPLELFGRFEGRVIAVIRRLDDAEDKWVVAPEGVSLTAEEILAAVGFQERFFSVEVHMGA